jgi:hypothetical protein
MWRRYLRRQMRGKYSFAPDHGALMAEPTYSQESIATDAKIRPAGTGAEPKIARTISRTSALDRLWIRDFAQLGQ